MNGYKMYEVNGATVLTTSEEHAIEICTESGHFSEDELEYIDIKECSDNDETWQPIETLKNVLSKEEIENITEQLVDYYDNMSIEKDGVNYYFEDCEYDYIGVLLKAKDILNNSKIFSEFELDSIIAKDY